jgi:hypothetical protein
MKEAQTISSPSSINGLYHTGDSYTHCPPSSEGGQLCQVASLKDASTRLATLYNSLHYYTIVLPSNLRYRGQYLNFDDCLSRLLHSSIYSIHLMTELTKLMIHKYNIFLPKSRSYVHTANSPEPKNIIQSSRNLYGRIDRALENYFQAADAILTAVSTSSEGHYRYVNPALSNIIWLATAVQLFRRKVCAVGSKRDLADSNFELLNLMHSHFVKYWKMSTAPEQILDSLTRYLRSIVPTGDHREGERVTSQN